MNTFWSKANQAFNERDRREYRDWRIAVALAVERIERAIKDKDERRVGMWMNTLKDLLSKMPKMYGKP